MTPCGERELALHAYFDGELDDAACSELDAHLAGCAGCRQELEHLATLAASVRRAMVGVAAGDAGAVGDVGDAGAPELLRARVRRALAAEASAPAHARPASGWVPWRRAAAAAVLVLAALGGYAVGAARSRDAAADAAAEDVLGSHLRALLPGRLTDVTASDRHQVKPWFAGRLDFAPPVPELAAAGFPLVGGRVDFVAGERAAAVSYLRRRHVIDVYILPDRPGLVLPAAARAGYALVSWREGSLRLIAISDVDRRDLLELARLHATAGPAGGR